MYLMRPHRLTRSLTDRTFSGVCGGLGAYVGVHSWWVRAVFVMLGLFTAGTGVLIYLALWYILPPETLNDIPADPALLTRRITRPENVILIGGAVIVMGLVILARNLGVLSGENGDAFPPLVIIVFGLMLLVKQLWRVA
jgi:phage shock protein C